MLPRLPATSYTYGVHACSSRLPAAVTSHRVVMSIACTGRDLSTPQFQPRHSQDTDASCFFICYFFWVTLLSLNSNCPLVPRYSLLYGTSWPRAVNPRFSFFFFSAPCRRLPVVSRDRLVSPHFQTTRCVDPRQQSTHAIILTYGVHCRAIVKTTVLPREPAISSPSMPMPTQPHQWSRFPDSRGPIEGYDDYTYYEAPDYGRFVPPEAQPRRSSWANRASIQTTNTDALTESTFSPHSPTASSFVGTSQGLAPRPPSYQHPVFATTLAHAGVGVGAGAGPGPGAIAGAPSSPSFSSPFGDSGFVQEHSTFNLPRHISRRRNYHSAEQNQEQAFESTAARPPAAPPGSYRQPQGHQPALPYDQRFSSGYTSPPARQFQFTHPLSYTQDQEMNPEANNTVRREEFPDIARQHVHDVMQRRGTIAPNTLPEGVAAGSQRGEPLEGLSERDQMFANSRSPLQRLEKTLGGMTKEEKRARVQAAEQRARERAARKAANAFAHHPSGVDDRAVSSEHQTVHSAPFTREPPPRQPDPREQSYLQHQTQHQPHPQQAVHRNPNAFEHSGEAASTPAFLRRREDEEELETPRTNVPSTRNLSFRDRTARSEQEPRARGHIFTEHPTAFFTGGNAGDMSMTRNRNDRPRDGAPHDQQNAQIAPETQQPHAAAVAKSKDKELPSVPLPPPEQWRGIVHRADEQLHETVHGSGEEHIPQETYGVASKETPNSRFAAVENGRRRLDRHDSDHSIESAPPHQLSRMIIRDPEDLRPGEGLYKPPMWLNEYEKATVGSLRGSLLDLASDSQPSAADRGKAWWEGGGRSKNASHSSRPRKAEAFDGEYDDTDGE